MESNENSSSEDLKCNGNILFSLKDYRSAKELYEKALDMIQSITNQFSNKSNDLVYTVGQSVLISFPGRLDWVAGFVSGVSSNRSIVSNNIRYRRAYLVTKKSIYEYF
jgi:tetratricopeptide (TPR) repeat protein